MPRDQDARNLPRAEIVLKVEFDQASDFIADTTANASSGGVFIATDKNFAIGEKLSFSISFPGLIKAIQCRGKVRWRRSPAKANKNEPAGIGVSFLFADEQERATIERLAASLTHPETDPETRPESGTGSDASQEEVFRVLLAEDNQAIRKMLRFGLRKFHGVKLAEHQDLAIVEAASFDQAWQALEKENFHLAIIDMTLPAIRGIDLVNKIRQSDSWSALPLIIAGEGDPESKQSAYQAGADLFLTRPVMLVQFFRSLCKLLGLEP